MNITKNDEFATFLQTVVEGANALQTYLLDVPEMERLDLVRKTVESSDLAFAIWNDPGSEYGVGFRLIKGHKVARECIANNRGVVTSRFAGSPRVDADQADALANLCGDATSGLQ